MNHLAVVRELLGFTQDSALFAYFPRYWSLVSTLGHLLTLLGTPTNKQDRTQMEPLGAQVQALTGESVELAYVDQGYTVQEPTQVAAAHGIRLEVVKLPETKRGFVLFPRRWVVERSLA